MMADEIGRTHPRLANVDESTTNGSGIRIAIDPAKSGLWATILAAIRITIRKPKIARPGITDSRSR
jgi:hypothetical protein